MLHFNFYIPVHHHFLLFSLIFSCCFITFPFPVLPPPPHNPWIDAVVLLGGTPGGNSSMMDDVGGVVVGGGGGCCLLPSYCCRHWQASRGYGQFLPFSLYHPVPSCHSSIFLQYSYFPSFYPTIMPSFHPSIPCSPFLSTVTCPRVIQMFY